MEEVTMAEENPLLVSVEDEVQYFLDLENYSALKSKLVCSNVEISKIIQELGKAGKFARVPFHNNSFQRK